MDLFSFYFLNGGIINADDEYIVSQYTNVVFEVLFMKGCRRINLVGDDQPIGRGGRRSELF